MKVFLSWSGERSNMVAKAFHDWLPSVVESVQPWLSERDIEKGARSVPAIAAQLEDTSFGIICLTADNLEQPWIHFEAGALAKTKDAKVCTFLLDIGPAEVRQPLAKFQATRPEKNEIRNLVFSIVRRVRKVEERGPSDDVVAKAFERFWPDLETPLHSAKAATSQAPTPVRRTDDILEEILGIVRRLEREHQEAEKQPVAGRLTPLENEILRTRLNEVQLKDLAVLRLLTRPKTLQPRDPANKREEPKEQ